MATILDKDLTRESTVKIDGREVQVTLTADQKISFKLKGMKSGMVSIGIEDLYAQLAGIEKPLVTLPTVTNKATPLKKGANDTEMVPVSRLRSMLNVTPMSREAKTELAGFIGDILNKDKFSFDE